MIAVLLYVLGVGVILLVLGLTRKFHSNEWQSVVRQKKSSHPSKMPPTVLDDTLAFWAAGEHAERGGHEPAHR